MKGAIYLIIVGSVIAILTLLKPNFFWNHPKAAFVRKFLGDKGTTILYLIASLAMLTYGIYSFILIDKNKLLQEANDLYEIGQLDEAESKLIEFTSSITDNYIGWTILGHIYLDKENFEKAVECYNNAIKVDSNAFEPISGLGMVYSAQGNFEEARDYYLKANEVKPNQGTVIGNIAGLYNNLGDIEKAIEFGEKSIQLDQTNSTLYANLSIYYNIAKQYEKRDEMFNKAKEFGYDDMESILKTYELYNDTIETND